MGGVFSTIYSVWNQIVFAFSNFRWADVIDIAVIAYIFYKAIAFLRETRAGQLVKGIVILLVLLFVANWWELATLNWLLSSVMDSAIIVLALIFQPELRRVLERVGRTNFSRGQFFEKDEGQAIAECIDSVSKAAAIMQEKKIGALIVFERTTQLGEIINTGTIIDAEASVSMINNVFFPKSPLHDGAMIIRGGRLYAAGCILPLTQREDLSLQLGTRHRAAIGMTENSDSVVLVVSEETGIISIVTNGQITRNFNAVSAGAELKRLLIDDEQNEKTGAVSAIFKRIIPQKKHNEGDAEE